MFSPHLLPSFSAFYFFVFLKILYSISSYWSSFFLHYPFWFLMLLMWSHFSNSFIFSYFYINFASSLLSIFFLLCLIISSLVLLFSPWFHNLKFLSAVWEEYGFLLHYLWIILFFLELYFLCILYIVLICCFLISLFLAFFNNIVKVDISRDILKWSQTAIPDDLPYMSCSLNFWTVWTGPDLWTVLKQLCLTNNCKASRKADMVATGTDDYGLSVWI